MNPRPKPVTIQVLQILKTPLCERVLDAGGRKAKISLDLAKFATNAGKL